MASAVHTSLHRYRSHNYSFRGAVNEALCLGWARTPAAWHFACAWTFEVSLFSMREQLSFHHAMPANLSVRWVPWAALEGS